MTELKVIHAPEAVAGNSPGLARAECEVGFDSEAICLRPHPFGYEGVHVFGGPDLTAPGTLLGMASMFVYVLRNADVLHLNFGRSILDPGPNFLSRIPRWTLIPFFIGLLQRFEFLCYRLRGIPVFMTYQGDDARQRDYSLEHFRFSMAQAVEPDYYPPGSDEWKRRRIAFFSDRVSKSFYLNPDLNPLLPEGSEFLPYTSVDPREWNTTPSEGKKILHLVHAPSHRGTKGTAFVIEAVEKLRQEGLAFEFTLLEGKTHDEAKAIYATADLVVDQLLAGWYGGLAVECMALEKPVIAYLRESDLGAIPAGMKAELPFIEANPETITDVLRDWLQRPASELSGKGHECRAFVEKWHDPIAIARRMKSEYEAAIEDRRR